MTTSNYPDLDEVDISDMDTSHYPSSSSNELTICPRNVHVPVVKQDVISDYLLESTSTTILLGLNITLLTNSVSDASGIVDSFKLFSWAAMEEVMGSLCLLLIRCWRRPNLENDNIEGLWLMIHNQ